MSGQLTSAEASARLGVQRSTLYAYVSRGLITRTVALDGRTSLFDADEVDRLREGRRTVAEGELSTLITSRVTEVGPDRLQIRGRSIDELISQGQSFEAVADELWGSRPGDVWPEVNAPSSTSQEVAQALSQSTRPLDRLRITTAISSSEDPLRHDLSDHSTRSVGRELITAMVCALPERSELPAGSSALADQLWIRLTDRRGTRAQRHVLNAALVSLIDHGLAGSTFAARIAASVRADPYSVVLAGLGVLGGRLHGAASAPVHDLFEAAHVGGDVAAAIGAAQRDLDRLPGFGHSVYQSVDPRCEALLGLIEAAWARDPRYEVISDVTEITTARTDSFPNIDFALGALSWLAHMDSTAGEAVFAISRTVGWLAHAMEEYTEAPLRFRSRARYLPPQAP